MTTLAIEQPVVQTNRFFGERERLRNYAARALARLRFQEALFATAAAANVSAWLMCLLILADRLFSLQQIGINIWIIWGGLSALGIPYVLWRAYSPRIHETLAAVLADDRLGLQARLSSALTLDFNNPATAAFSTAFFEEALFKLEALNVEKAFPVNVPKAFIFLLLPAFASASLYMFMSPRDSLGLVAARDNKRKAEEASRKAARALDTRLEDLKTRALDRSDEQSAQYKINQLVQKADAVAKELKDGKRNPDDAVVALGQLKQEIQKEREKLTENKDFLSQLEKLSAKDLNLEESDLTKEVSEALKMGDAGLAARQLRKLAQKVKNDILDNPNKTDEQKKQELQHLQREVEKLAGALAEDQALKENLTELSEKVMSASEFQSLQEEIKKQMQKQGKNNKKLGSDIERQMEDTAQELERQEEDNDSNLNEEEEKEKNDLDNLEEGMDEAMQGLNGEEGEKGGQQGQQSQEKGGSKSGAPKSGKLAHGAKKSGSGKSRSGSKQSGQGDQQGQQAGQKGGENQNGQRGGKPGDGLGGGGQGQGSRPFHQIADPGFKAEKAPGKLQSGAITGLSHFRGQGAKGDAPAEFVQALSSAEQDASSSLELERIPVDAREVVKDYFLKVREGAGIHPAGGTPPAAKSQTPAAESLKE